VLLRNPFVQVLPFEIGDARTMRLALPFIAMALAASAGTAERATARGAVKSVHNDWQVRCDTPAGAQHEQCALMQSVMAAIADSLLLKSPQVGILRAIETVARFASFPNAYENRCELDTMYITSQEPSALRSRRAPSIWHCSREWFLTTRLLVRHVAQGSARPCPSRNASQPAHGLARGLVRPAVAPWPRVKMAP
jgi:hypothetical protein